MNSLEPIYSLDPLPVYYKHLRGDNGVCAIPTNAERRFTLEEQRSASSSLRPLATTLPLPNPTTTPSVPVLKDCVLFHRDRYPWTYHDTQLVDPSDS